MILTPLKYLQRLQLALGQVTVNQLAAELAVILCALAQLIMDGIWNNYGVRNTNWHAALFCMLRGRKHAY
eukprot:6039120-Pleurochrysis_carterae.AAC.2